jgi:hypothetical protein
MPPVRHPSRWIGGSAIALAGVLVAKVLGPELLPYQYHVYSMAAGTLVAVSGLFVAASGSAAKRQMPHPDKSPTSQTHGPG